MLTDVLKRCDYIEFPACELAVNEFFEEDSIFGYCGVCVLIVGNKKHKDKGYLRVFIDYSPSMRNNINGFGYVISEASFGHQV